MSFERFTPDTTSSWDQTAPSSPPVLSDGDGQLHNVLGLIEHMEHRDRPSGYSERQWYILLKDLRHVAEQWLDIALMCDWPLIHLFGAPPVPHGRVGLTGVGLLLQGRSIESIDENRIVIANRLGAPNVYWRHAPGASQPFSMAGVELIWDAINRDEWA